ncbi:MAG: PilZ domain-containing protein [Planctomycetota bacterium]
MSEKYKASIQLSDRARAALLDGLDASSEDKAPTGRNKREQTRYPYRAAHVALDVQHPGGGIQRWLVAPRNLSAGGIGFVYKGFLHHGTLCVVTMGANSGEITRVTGEVVACRLLKAPIHEVGVRFHEKIDPAAFCDERTMKQIEQRIRKAEASGPKRIAVDSGTVLVATPDGKEAGLIRQALAVLGISHRHVATVAELSDALATPGVLGVLIDVDGFGGMNHHQAPARVVRDVGFTGPVAALTNTGDCTRNDVVDVVGLPTDMSRLAATLEHFANASENRDAA